MKVGDMVKLHHSPRRNGKFANMSGLIVNIDLNRHSGITVLIGGVTQQFHCTQIGEVIDESR